jgi:PAS domain S-box-containing protein
MKRNKVIRKIRHKIGKRQILLEQEETRFMEILDYLGEGFAILDMDYNLVYVNTTAQSFLKINAEMTSIKRFLSENTYEDLIKSFKDLPHSKKEINEIEIMLENNNPIYILLTSTPKMDEDGKCIGIYCIFRDITAYKNIETALRQSQEKFSTAFQATPDAIIISHLSDGRIIEVNEAYLQLSGYSRQETLNRSTIEMNFWYDKDERAVLLNELKEKGRIFEKEFNFRIKSGELRTTTISIEKLKIGNIPCLLSIIRDINDRKKAENVLRQSELRFRELFDHAPVGYHELDIDGKIVEINNTELEMLGYSREEMIDHYGWEFIQDKEQSKLRTFGKLTGIGYISKSSERVFIKKNGENIYTLVDDLLLKNSDGIITGIRSTVQDISEQKRNELALHESNIRLEKALTELRETQKQILQQERLRALGQMASGIAHDINNSLTPIMGYIDILTEDELIKKRGGKELEKIDMATRDIKRTIQRMKEFYRPKIDDDGLLSIDLNNIIKGTLDLTKHKWKDIPESHGAVINIALNLEKNLPPIVGNESEIREALTNLIINAADAMPDGGNLSLITSFNNDHVMIEISDTGIGMDDETQKRCFEPFYSTKGDKGTGLGLSMVYGIIERHEGIIKISSELNKGTTFQLIFPYMGRKNIHEIDIINTSKPEKLKILIIDDEFEVRELVKRMLSKIGHTIHDENSGSKGLEIFISEIRKGEPFNLVITDLGMPHMDGKTLSQLIKDISPQIPIILLTGWGSFLEKDNFNEVDCILSKPITKSDLLNAIAQCFKK